MKRALFPILAFVATPVLASGGAAQTIQDTALIDRAVAGFTGHAVGQEGGARTPVDPRLRLAACPMVTLAWYTDRHDAVVVSCPGPQWRVFVAIRMPPPAPVVPATVIAAPKPVPVIKRGDPVTIVAGSDGFSVTRDGIAMGDAVAGARVAVQVEPGKPPVQTIAVEPGKVTLPGAQ